MKLEIKTARRVKIITYSALSEILKIAAKPEIISLAGGLPAAETFPLEIIKYLSNLVIKKYQATAFQYGPTDGVAVLKEAVVEWVKEREMKISPENVGIVSGSQQALDCLARILIDKGDKIAVESPTYLGAVDAFAPYYPSYEQIETDEEGVIPESLERILRSKKIKFVYLIPTFQNPTGKTIPWSRRKKISQIIKKYATLLVEDDPYYVLRYQGTFIPPIQTLIPENTIYLSSFSKVLSPGLRTGFYIAPKKIVRLMIAAKQSVDLHSCSFSQYIAAEYLKTGHLKKHLPNIIRVYRKRLQVILKALENYFPKSFTWTKPEGGMFIWLTGQKNFDAVKFYFEAVKNNVAFVPGTYFYVKKGEGKNTLRLNFTNINEKQIVAAIKKLALILNK